MRTKVQNMSLLRVADHKSYVTIARKLPLIPT